MVEDIAITYDGFYIEESGDFLQKFREIILDFKTKLQEILQKNGEVEIRYELDKYEGPPHRRKFFTTVIIDNKVMGNGYGYSKKESEQCAAKEALRLLGE